MSSGHNDQRPLHLPQHMTRNAGTPVIMHDEGVMTTGTFVTVLARDPSRKNPPFIKNFLPFPEEQTVLQNPVGMFSELLTRHPPRNTAVSRAYQYPPDIEAMMRQYVPFNSYYPQVQGGFRQNLHQPWYNTCLYCGSNSHTSRFCQYNQQSSTPNTNGHNSSQQSSQIGGHLGSHQAGQTTSHTPTSSTSTQQVGQLTSTQNINSNMGLTYGQ